MARTFALAMVLGLSACAEAPSATIVPPVHQAKASYYSEGQRVACPGWGRFNPHLLTVAHRTLPCGTRLKVWRSGLPPIEVTVNDRGPAAWTHRDLDLSLEAGLRMGLKGPGVATVSYQLIK